MACACSTRIAIGFSVRMCFFAAHASRDVLGMQFGRRRDVDGVEVGLPQHRRQVGMHRNAGFRGNGVAHLGGRLGDGDKLESRIAANRRKERPAGGPHSDDPDSDSRLMRLDRPRLALMAPGE